MSNPNLIFCKNHSSRKAYRYCDSCKEFICNSCAFNEKHMSHLQKIKSFKELLKTFFPNINYQNISNLSKYIELFHFILNYNSSFMSFDLNEIMDQINDKFDTYINKLIELKVNFKILISEKFGILQSIYAEQEKKIIETQNKLLYILNNEDVKYFEKLNTSLEQIRMNKNEKKMLGFIEEYNQLMRKSFDDDIDFENKYTLFMAQKLVDKSNKYIKENILDKLIQKYFDEETKKIDDLYQKINSQNNQDIDTLKKNFEYINADYNLDEEEKRTSKQQKKNSLKSNFNDNEIINAINNINNNILNDNIQKEKEKETKPKMNQVNMIKQELEKKIKDDEKEKEKETKPKTNQVNLMKQELEKKIKDEDKKQFYSSSSNKLNKITKDTNNEIHENKKAKEHKQKNQVLETIQLEFEPPEIETCQFTKEELAEMDMDDDYENEFLKIEEDGDDGLLLAEIIDGNCSDNATFDSEQFYVDNLDDKLDIQYYEGIKFEGEGEGEGLNDEAIVDDANEEENKEEAKKEEEKKEENKKEEIKKEENKKEEIPKKSNNVEEVKKQLMNNLKQNNPPTQTKTEKIERKQSKQTTNKNKKQDKDINIAELIEDKKEQEETKPTKEKNKTKDKDKDKEKEKEEKTKENKGDTDKKLGVLCELVKAGKKNSTEFQEGLKQLSWGSRGKVELMAVDQKNSALKIYNILTEKIEEIKIDFKLPLHLCYINLPPYLYISGGKVNGKDITSISKISRTGQNSVKCEEFAQLAQGRSSHCMVYVKSANSLFFISGSRNKTCEKYNFSKNRIESFPGLKVAREKCCACLLNEKYLYVFFGFDRAKNKFETTIEKIYLNDAMSWEVVNLFGNQNILKKQSFACIPLIRDGQKGILITGGINSLRNETKETVYINIEKSKAEVFNPLPVNTSFTNSYFVNFEKYAISNDIINFSNDFNAIKFSCDKFEFS